MKRTLFYILPFVIIFSGCGDKSSFSVEGTAKPNAEKTLYIKKVDVDNTIILDSAKINKKGEFKFKENSPGSAFYQLGFNDNFITLLAEPGEKINIVFNNKNLFENYFIKGSPGSEKLQFLDYTLADTKRKLDSLTSVYNSLQTGPDLNAKKVELEVEFNNLIMAQRKKNIEFIIKNASSLASIKALYQMINPDTYVLYSPNDVQYMKIVTDSLTKYYPNSSHVQALARDLGKEMNQLYANQLGKIAENIPPTKLDPVLSDISGKKIALSSLKGKYVLLAFWSVKSRECIAENIQLKEYYKLYNKKGFEIYQINIDENEADWRDAVRFDELPWISTREDDPANPKNVILFNVTSLPTNYLFDKEGNIIGSNLHGRSLKIRLEQLFKN